MDGGDSAITRQGAGPCLRASTYKEEWGVEMGTGNVLSVKE